MAYESIAVTPGVGASIGGDVVGGLFHQAIKIDVGADGVVSGPVCLTNPMPSQALFGTTPVSASVGMPHRYQVPNAAGGFLSSAKIDHAAAGENAVIAGVAAQTSRIHRMFFKCDSAVNIFFKDAAGGTALTGTMIFAAGDSFVLDFDGEPWFETAVAGAFIINLSVAVGIRGRIYYKQSV